MNDDELTTADDETAAIETATIETATIETATIETATIEATPVPGHDLDLTAIRRELDDVQAALERLNDGTYWIDEITGQPIPDQTLTDDPLARTTAAR